MEKNDDLLRRITVNPAVFQGKPTVRGMRIKVETILSLLEHDDIRACLAYARSLVANEDLSAVRVETA